MGNPPPLEPPWGFTGLFKQKLCSELEVLTFSISVVVVVVRFWIRMHFFLNVFYMVLFENL